MSWRTPPILRKFMGLLGVKRLDIYDYLSTYVFPYLPDMATEGKIESIKKLLGFISVHQSEWSPSEQNKIKSVRLIPNRNGRLCAPLSLYDPQEPVFNAAFGNVDSFLPSRSIPRIHLEELGVNMTLTKETFIACVQRLESEYKRDIGGLWNRTRPVWDAFVNRVDRIQTQTWTQSDLQSLVHCHFVPVDRFMLQSYRDVVIREHDSTRYIVATLKDVIAPRYASVAWTQRYLCLTEPSKWVCSLFDFSPSVQDVVQHLVELATIVAGKCRITESDFYRDLANTYYYLNSTERATKASAIIMENYANEKLWLNEDSPLDRIANVLAKRDRLGVNNISDLQWLRSKSIVLGVGYDMEKTEIYSAKQSIVKYDALLKGCGSNGIRSINANLAEENVNEHRNDIVRCLKSMRDAGSLCDLSIIVEGISFNVHGAVLATVSQYFRALLVGRNWKESGTGILNLDEHTRPDEQSSSINSMQRPYGSAESVRQVIEWAYTGVVDLDDGNFKDNVAVSVQLDVYLDILQLADVWDIPKLRTHIENRVLLNSKTFVRPENVDGILERVKEYNAKAVSGYCEEWRRENRGIVEGAAQEDGR